MTIDGIAISCIGAHGVTRVMVTSKRVPEKGRRPSVETTPDAYYQKKLNQNIDWVVHLSNLSPHKSCVVHHIVYQGLDNQKPYQCIVVQLYDHIHGWMMKCSHLL